MKRAADFTPDEIAVIRERRQYDDAPTLARVFGTSSHVIAAICRPTTESERLAG